MMERDAIVLGLMKSGVPRRAAEKRADELLAEEARQLAPSPFASGRGGGKTVALEQAAAVAEAAGVHVWRPGTTFSEATGRGLYHWPFRFVLPWSHLVSDNRKYGAIVKHGSPKLIHTAEYREAKRLARIAARRAWGDVSPYADGLLELTARVFFPNDYRKRDAHNFQKCAHDALKGIVIEDDDILVPRWIPAGVDVDAPRAELTLHPYPPV